MSTSSQDWTIPEILRSLWPGLDCIDYGIGGGMFSYRVRGPAELMVKFGVLTQKHVDIIPPCGISTPGRGLMIKHALPYYADILRAKDGNLLVRRGLDGDEAIAFCKNAGLPDPGRRVDPSESRAGMWVFPRPSNLKERPIGRFRRLVAWQTLDEKTIFIDWVRIQYENLQRQIAGKAS